MVNTQLITDKLYGEFLIESPVLIELINSKSVQRLKGVSQYGIPDEYNHRKGYSRYDHSIGVMLLLKKLKASEEEQIAGLLHDVSHTAFSHLIDWVVGDSTKEDFQDNNHLKVLEASEIPKILENYGYQYKKISKLEEFELLDRNIPDLCVDRIDYSLRQLPTAKTKHYINNLKVINGEIIFNNKNIALEYALDFLNLQLYQWGGYENSVRYKLFSCILKLALKKKLINIEDFWLEESQILDILKKSGYDPIDKSLALLKQKPFPQMNGKCENVKKKFRYVDPKFIENNKIFKVSEVNDSFKNEIEKYKAESLKGIEVPSFQEIFNIV